MERINNIIRVNHLLKYIPKLNISAKGLINLSKIAQETFYLNYLISLAKIKTCQFKEIQNYITGTPYERKLLYFKREKSGAARRKKSKYHLRSCFKGLKIVVLSEYKLENLKLESNWIAKEKAACF